MDQGQLQMRASLMRQALQWLARREHSRAELRVKLLQHVSKVARREAAQCGRSGGMEAEDPTTNGGPAAIEQLVDHLLEQLAERGWLDDARYIESKVRQRTARGGNRRIDHELSRHGLKVPPDLLKELVESEPARARAALEARYPEPPSDLKELARRQRFLAARGFSPDSIRSALRTPDEGED